MAMRSYREMVAKEQSSDVFRIESAKLDFAFGVNGLLKEKGLSQSDIAAKLNVSQAYVSKALRGDVNLTIASMVRLAGAAGAMVHIDVRSAEQVWSAQAARPIFTIPRMTFEVDSAAPQIGRFIHRPINYLQSNDATYYADESVAA